VVVTAPGAAEVVVAAVVAGPVDVVGAVGAGRPGVDAPADNARLTSATSSTMADTSRTGRVGERPDPIRAPSDAVAGAFG